MGKVFKVCEEEDWETTKNNEFCRVKNDLSDGFIFLPRAIERNLRKTFQIKKSVVFVEVETDDLE